MQTCYNCGRQVDDNVLICPDCGVREALTGMGISQEEQESILTIIHQCAEKME